MTLSDFPVCAFCSRCALGCFNNFQHPTQLRTDSVKKRFTLLIKSDRPGSSGTACDRVSMRAGMFHKTANLP